MRWNKIYAIYKKEIRELFRDKKTIFLMFAMPLLIYPLLIIGVSMVIMNVQSGYETKEYVIGIHSSVEKEAVTFIKEACHNENNAETGNESNNDKSDTTKVDVGRLDNDKQNQEQQSGGVSFEFIECDDYTTAFEDGTIDAYLSFNNDTYTIEYNSSDTDSSYASDYLSKKLDEYKDDISLKLFADANLDADKFLNPIRVELENLASGEQSMGSVLGMIVPLLLIMGVFIGTMTPAIDSTSGEKERGTQETLMSFPISGHELICGKYLAVSAAGVLSAFLYLLSVGILAAYLYVMAGMVGEVDFNLGMFVPALLVVIISTIAFALFLGAVIMCICSFAKSTKEASSYISPMMMIIMLIAYAGYLDVHLSVELSIVPVLNIVLLIKSVLAFEYNTLAIILVLVSNIAYAAIAITVLGKLYTSERILFGENFGSLFERRSDRQKGTVPTIGDAVLVLLVTAVLFLYVGGIIQMKLLLIGVGISHIFIVGVPLIAAWYGKVDYKKTFSLNRFELKKLPAVFITAIGGFLVCNIACMPLSEIFGDSMQQYSNSFSVLMSSQNIWVTWFIIGVIPAISEEAIFRGYMLSSLREKTKPVIYIVITALVFAIYHMNLYQGCYAFLMGIILAYTVYKTNSIYASSLIHFMCNSISVFLSETSIVNIENATDWQIIIAGIAGVILLVAGIWFISVGKTPTSISGK